MAWVLAGRHAPPREAAGMKTITFPEIYVECLDIAYREADSRLEGPALNMAIVSAADALYVQITGELIARPLCPRLKASGDDIHATKILVEMRGLEPLTSNLQSWRSTN